MKLFLKFCFLLFVSSNIFAQKDIELYSSAMEKFNKNDFSYALNIFEQIVNLDEVDKQLLASSEFYIAECLLGMQQVDGAMSQYQSFIIEYPHSAFVDLALYKLGSLYFNRKQYRLARNSLISLINNYPSSKYIGSAYYLIGESFTEENNIDKAEKFFQTSIKKHNNSFADYSLFSLAGIYEKKGDYENAVKYYDKLLGFYSKSKLAPQAQLRIGNCYFKLGEYDNAVIELSDPLIEKLPTKERNEADFILANCFYRLKEYGNASDTYKRILNNSPTKEMLDKIRYGLAWIHFHEGHYQNAYKLFNTLSKSVNDSIAIKSFYWSGEAQRYAGHNNEAIKIHKAFAKKYPNHPLAERVRLNIGISKFSEKSFEDSEDALLKSIYSKDPFTKAKSLTLLGEINLRKKEYRTAAEYFKRGLLVPQIAAELKDRCYLGLGVAYFFQKNYVAALEELISIDMNRTKVDKNKLNFYLAEVNFYLGNYSRAVSYYNRIKSAERRIVKNSLYGKAYSYFNLRDYTKSAYLFNQFVKKYKRDRKYAESKMRLADSYYALKEFEKASKIYKDVLTNTREFTNNESAYFNYAQTLFKAGNADEAITVLKKIQNKFPTSKYADDSQYLIGWINFQRNKFEDAIDNYKKLIEFYSDSPTLPIAYYSIGDSYFNLGNYKKAIENYKKVIKNYPKTKYVYDAVNGIQYCYIVQDKYKNAISFLSKFIASHKDLDFLDKIQFKKAEIYYNNSEYQLAINEFSKVIDNYPKSSLVPAAYYWMGKSEVFLKHPEKAINYFEIVRNISLNTEVGFNSVLEAGKIYRMQKDLESEIKLYDDVSSKLTNPKELSELNFNKAQAYIENNDISSAYKVLNEIIAIPDGSLFYYKAEIELGILELVKSNYENAINLFKNVSENRKDDLAAKALYYQGLANFQQGEYNKAVESFIKVRSLYAAYDEWYSQSLLRLGDSYVKLGENEKAKEMYKAVLTRHKRDPLAKEATEKLKKL